MEDNPKSIQEKHTQNISLEKSVLTETKEQDIARIQNILYNIFDVKEGIEPLDSDSENFQEKSCVDIHLEDFEDGKFAKSLKYLKFFDICRFYSKNIDSKNRYFGDFLESSFPNKINSLMFVSSTKMVLNRSNYLNPLINLSYQVNSDVIFYRFSIGFPQLKRLVAAYKHVSRLEFKYCKLSIPSVPNFSNALTNCQIQELSFEGSGTTGLSDWAKDFDQFENLIQGLASSSDLRLSLEKMVIYNCGVNPKESEQVFGKNQLDNVRIITYY
ncbi:unnamed protein product [Moneuplotes crassus]|uniref:Uncharacterized protein n=1 Tax=Euplotes crassus TaxID=5936 RepID=A0AAD1US28_EUPCR|nr:unnamed protein product [Moneuplotes crassus]